MASVGLAKPSSSEKPTFICLNLSVLTNIDIPREPPISSSSLADNERERERDRDRDRERIQYYTTQSQKYKTWYYSQVDGTGERGPTLRESPDSFKLPDCHTLHILCIVRKNGSNHNF